MILWGGTTTSIAFSKPLEAIDADDKKVILNEKGKVTLVLIGNDETEEEVRQAADALDHYRGHPHLRLLVVIDLRDSFGAMAPSLVKYEMRNEMDEEAKRLKPLYEQHQNQRNPRDDLSAIPDFEGQVVQQLGWPNTTEKLRAILFNTEGKEINRWNALTHYAAMQRAVAAAIAQQQPKD